MLCQVVVPDNVDDDMAAQFLVSMNMTWHAVLK